MTDPTLTVKQEVALDALRERGELRVSNRTDFDAGLVYWQTSNALVDAGLARRFYVAFAERVAPIGGT